MRESNLDTPDVIAHPPLIVLATVFVGLLAQRVRAAPLLPDFATPLRRAAGLLCILAGIATAVWAAVTLRRGGTNVDPHKPTLAIVTNGPYRFSRNPIYASMTAVVFGLSLLRNTAWLAALLPAMLLTIQRGVIEREERYLDRRFGDEYRAYRQTAPRWL